MTDTKELIERAKHQVGTMPLYANTISVICDLLNAVDESAKKIETLKSALLELRLVTRHFWNDDSPHIEELDAACAKADEVLK